MTAISQARVGAVRLELIQGDITQQNVDAIVNAANPSLAGGGGVDGAIHQAAGPELVRASRQLAPCPTGEARITGGFNLKARHVIHTVGPIYYQHDDPAALLAATHQSSLRLAQEHQLKSIAFPAISTGIYGYPLEEAAPVALHAVSTYINENQPSFELVRFVLFSPKAMDAFSQALSKLITQHDSIEAI